MKQSESVYFKKEKKSDIDLKKARYCTERCLQGLSILRYLETKMELPNQKFLDNDEKLKKKFQADADNAKNGSITTIETLLKEIDLTKEYLLKRKAELKQEG